MTLIYFIIVLSVTVFIHELGHFIFAKRAGIYVYEFSIGMGPRLFKFNRKNDETDYCIRLLPIGGFVQMAGESIEEDKDIPLNKRMQSKTWLQRFLTVIAGVMFNFILAIVVFFIVGMTNGVPNDKTIVGKVEVDSPAYLAGLEQGMIITKIDNTKVKTVDRFLLEYQIRIGEELKLEVIKDGNTKTITINPSKVDDNYTYGFSFDNTIKKDFLSALKYSFTKFASLLEQMILIIWYLCTGSLSLNSLSGPVGIFNIVGESAKAGFINVIYLIGYLSLNVGFINLLPIPAFDGGRILFMIIEKIRRKPLDPKVENTIHSIGFILLMLLMVVITYNDILRFIK